MADQSIIAIAQKYIEAACKEYDIKKAYLFGSHVRGTQKSESDIDIALVLSDIDNFFDTQSKLMKLRRNIDLRIEPHPVLEKEFNEDDPFAKEVLETGILIQ